jgi:hypothetical protein
MIGPNQPNIQPALSFLRRFRWPAIIVGLLLAHMTLMAAAVTIANRDHSFVAMPGYYERAVNWDKDQADRREAARLGWKVEVITSPNVDPLGRRAVSFKVTDATGKSIENASLEVRFYHNSHGGQPERLSYAKADPDDPTRFTTLAPMRYAGIWQFDFAIHSGSTKAVLSAVQTVENAAAARAN